MKLGDPAEPAAGAARSAGRGSAKNSNTSKMIYDVATLIEHITTWTPLSPGDVIATGTPEGVGLARKPQWFLKAGDVVTTAIEKLGVLENPVVDEQPAKA